MENTSWPYVYALFILITLLIIIFYILWKALSDTETPESPICSRVPKEALTKPACLGGMNAVNDGRIVDGRTLLPVDKPAPQYEPLVVNDGRREYLLVPRNFSYLW